MEDLSIITALNQFMFGKYFVKLQEKNKNLQVVEKGWVEILCKVLAACCKVSGKMEDKTASDVKLELANFN